MPEQSQSTPEQIEDTRQIAKRQMAIKVMQVMQMGRKQRRRQGYRLPSVKSKDTCPVCGGPLGTVTAGQIKKYCSPECRNNR